MGRLRGFLRGQPPLGSDRGALPHRLRCARARRRRRSTRAIQRGARASAGLSDSLTRTPRTERDRRLSRGRSRGTGACRRDPDVRAGSSAAAPVVRLRRPSCARSARGGAAARAAGSRPRRGRRRDAGRSSSGRLVSPDDAGGKEVGHVLATCPPVSVHRWIEHASSAGGRCSGTPRSARPPIPTPTGTFSSWRRHSSRRSPPRTRRNDPLRESFPPSHGKVPANRDLMEAAGIEPASAVAPNRASTSVVHALISPGGRFVNNLPTGQPSLSLALRAIGSP